MNIIRPFGPPIYENKILDNEIIEINKYLDENLLQDFNKKKDLDASKSLVGKVKEEIFIEKHFLENNILKILAPHINQYLTNCNYRLHKEIIITSCWTVRQFKSEYNPVHSHNGDVSGVLYLKFPKEKKNKKDGSITFINSPTFFLNTGHLTFYPNVGSIYLFPSYLLHTVYPVRKSNEERRSLAFNANIKPSPTI